MAATIKISSWKWLRTERQVQIHNASSIVIEGSETTVIEIVEARFEIFGGEPISKTNRSVNAIHPSTLHIDFRSVNGTAWGVDYGTAIVGHNMKKDGELGKEAVVKSYDFPKWAKALVERDADDRSDALDWVRAEYPR